MNIYRNVQTYSPGREVERWIQQPMACGNKLSDRLDVQESTLLQGKQTVLWVGIVFDDVGGPPDDGAGVCE